MQLLIDAKAMEWRDNDRCGRRPEREIVIYALLRHALKNGQTDSICRALDIEPLQAEALLLRLHLVTARYRRRVTVIEERLVAVNYEPYSVSAELRWK